MLRRPPRSTRTDTLFPYTTLFRNVLLLNAMAAQFHFDAGDIADEAASGEVDPHILDISACDPFGLLDRFAHCLLGTFHVRAIAAPHTSADRKSTRLNSSH